MDVVDIARAMYEAPAPDETEGAVWPPGHPEDVGWWMSRAAAIMPLLNRVRAEALRETATYLDEHFQDIPAWVEAYRDGVRTDDWMQGGARMTMGAIGMLRTRADRIEGSSRG